MQGTILNNATDIYLGNQRVDSVWLGNVKVWPQGPQHDYSQDYLTIESLSSNNEIYWKASGIAVQLEDIYASIDGGQTWSAYQSTTSGSGTYITTLSAGEKIMFKVNETNHTVYTYGAGISASTSNRFKTTGRVNISGNIMSLLYDNFIGKTTFKENTSYNPPRTYTNQFNWMFTECKVISAKNLILPATTLTDYCYRDLFNNCEYLVEAPALPATTLAEGCYYRLFNDCTNLTTAPVLPATILTTKCYYEMFGRNTTSTTDRTALNTVCCYAQDISATDCLYHWMYNVATSGTFYKDASTTFPSGTSGIPSNWTVVNI